jgi:hypothetical protein
MATLRIHRDIFPRTDHGYTWTECLWFERDGNTVSPTIPAAVAVSDWIICPVGLFFVTGPEKKSSTHLKEWTELKTPKLSATSIFTGSELFV